MKYRNILLGAALLSMSLLSCGKKSEQTTEETVDENIIEITSDQFKTNKMMLGSASKQSFSDDVTCKGFLQAPTDGIAKVSTPVAGTVQNVRFKIGDYVNHGQVICTVAGNEFMSLQQEFAEAAASFQKAKADYERMKALRAENIGAKKDYVSAESVYKASQASYNALKARIRLLNVNPSQIENGQMYSSFPVVSPIGGYVTRSEVVVGQYVDMMNELAEVVNVSKLQLQLSVFEVDIPKLEVGQTVRFAVSGAPDDSIRGTLVTIGKTINPDTKSVDCIARIEDTTKSKLVNQSYVEAKVEVSKVKAMALPSSAVSKSGDEYFIFVVEKNNADGYTLRRTKVGIGRSNDDFIEIVSGLPAGSNNVVLSGVDTF